MPRKRSNDLDEDGDVKKQKKSFEPINVRSNIFSLFTMILDQF